MQGTDHEVGLSRRTMFATAASAAIGAFALNADPASAQRCPAVPPPRVKGPPVWLDMDQQELDDAYDQSVYAFNQPNIAERSRANSEWAQTIIGKPQRVAYGPSEYEKLDIYRTNRPDAPVNIFIHGGAWRAGRSAAARAHLALPLVKAGAHFVGLDFIDVDQAGGSLFPMIEQIRRAVGWVYR